MRASEKSPPALDTSGCFAGGGRRKPAPCFTHAAERRVFRVQGYRISGVQMLHEKIQGLRFKVTKGLETKGSGLRVQSLGFK